MTTRIGILQNSPLIYVLASIRFAPWPLLGKKIDEIHDELREITPLIQRIKIESLSSGQASQTEEETVWMLMSSDRSYGFHLAPEQLLMYSNEYNRYAEFEEILAKSLRVLLKHMRFLDIFDLGVRYVDHIKLREGDVYETYISERLLPAGISGLVRSGGLTKNTYQSGEAELRIGCIAQPGALSVPNDLIGVLAMAQEPGKKLQLNKLGERDVILDIDAIKRYPRPERMDNKDAILTQLDKLHVTANAFFRHQDVCTEHAFRVWKGEV